MNEPDDIIDLPPEYCQYQDEGCEFSGQCLNCPLPLCVYEEPGGRVRYLKRRRSLEMARLFREGKNVKELAVMFRVSVRTVQRSLRAVIDEAEQAGTPAPSVIPADAGIQRDPFRLPRRPDPVGTSSQRQCGDSGRNEVGNE
jgi:hypothetical protein